MKPVWQIAGLWRPEALWLAFGAALSLGAVAAGALLIGASGGAIALALTGGFLLLPVALQLAGPLRVSLRYLERVFTHEATFRALADLRVWLFKGLAKSAAGGLGFRRAGDSLARLVNDVDSLDGLYLRISVPLLGALLLLPILAVLLWQASPFAEIVLVPFAVGAFLLPWLAAKAAQASGPAAGLAMADLRNAALDALTGLPEVKVYAAEGRMLAAVQSREASLLAAQRALAGDTSRINAAAFLLAQAGVLAAIFCGLLAPPGPALVAVFVAIFAFEAVLALPRAGLLFGQAAAAAARVVEAANAPPPVPDPAVPAAMPAGTAIAFEHVSFRYGADMPWVFQDLSLQIPANTRIAILGASGAGKSTLASLLLKLAAPEQGVIRFGTADLAALPAEAVRARIAYLSQSTHLFADNIRNNLRLGDPAADDERLWAALEAAQVAQTVRALPDGLDHYLTEGGRNLSGGQGRRIALARLLLSDAPVLILDEPCAGLDAATELAFMETMNAATQGRTVLLILHRLTGAERLDRIWRLTAGHLVAAAG